MTRSVLPTSLRVLSVERWKIRSRSPLCSEHSSIDTVSSSTWAHYNVYSHCSNRPLCCVYPLQTISTGCRPQVINYTHRQSSNKTSGTHTHTHTHRIRTGWSRSELNRMLIMGVPAQLHSVGVVVHLATVLSGTSLSEIDFPSRYLTPGHNPN